MKIMMMLRQPPEKCSFQWMPSVEAYSDRFSWFPKMIPFLLLFLVSLSSDTDLASYLFHPRDPPSKRLPSSRTPFMPLVSQVKSRSSLLCKSCIPFSYTCISTCIQRTTDWTDFARGQTFSRSGTKTFLKLNAWLRESVSQVDSSPTLLTVIRQSI